MGAALVTWRGMRKSGGKVYEEGDIERKEVVRVK